MRDNKKKLINEYRQRTLVGGVYKITNSMTKMYLLGHTTDIRAMQNRFDFSVATGSCIHPKLQRDWTKFGGGIFTFDILEKIEMKKGQSLAEFMDELITLEEMCRGNLNVSKEY